MTKPRKAEDPTGPAVKHRRRFSAETKAQAVAIAELTGNASEAARQLAVPVQRVSEWLMHPDNADLRLRIQAKRIETALEIAEELPGLIRKTIARAHRLLEDDEAIRNGTQLLALMTAEGILESVQSRLLGSSSSGRYGSTEPNQALEQRAVLPPLELNQEG